MTVQELLLEVFCLIDDEGQAHPLGQLRPRRRDPVLTHSEGITIELVGKLLGFADDSDLFWVFAVVDRQDAHACLSIWPWRLLERLPWPSRACT